MNPHIRTELPGPKARAMIARDSAVISPSYPSRLSVRDVARTRHRDLGCRWQPFSRFRRRASRSAATGHAHPDVVASVREAAGEFLHISSATTGTSSMVGLGERIAGSRRWASRCMSFFCQSGTEAVEAALKLARYVTGRPRFIGFLGGFHGRTMGSLAFTSSKYTQQKGFRARHAGRHPCAISRTPIGRCSPATTRARRCLITFACCSSATAAVGSRGDPGRTDPGRRRLLVPPDGFLAGLRALCDEHGILLIFDEVQSGIGRTGKMFACQHWGVAPDIMTLAKGLGSGLPIGAVVAKKRLMSNSGSAAPMATPTAAIRSPARPPAPRSTWSKRAYLANAATVGAHFTSALA